ncbi:Sec20 domain containing protein [Amanita muscaria]
MPPLPATFDEETTDLVNSATRLQKDLAECQIPRLRACVGPLTLQQTYAAEVREDIEMLMRKVEALDLLVWDQKGEKNKRDLKGIVDSFKEELVKLRQESRAALLASKKNIDSQSRSRREELVGSAVVAEQRQANGKVTGDALMKANNDVTDALRRTVSLMQGELERSVLSTQLLDASSASLKSTSSGHDRLTDLMSTSKQLVTVLEKTDWLDRMLIVSAFAFFLLVVLFIVKQRVIDRGLRIAFWWTRFLPDFSADEEVLRSGEIVSSLSKLATDTASTVSVVATVTLLATLSSLGVQETLPPVVGTDIPIPVAAAPSTHISTALDSMSSILPEVHVEL